MKLNEIQAWTLLAQLFALSAEEPRNFENGDLNQYRNDSTHSGLCYAVNDLEHRKFISEQVATAMRSRLWEAAERKHMNPTFDHLWGLDAKGDKLRVRFALRQVELLTL